MIVHVQVRTFSLSPSAKIVKADVNMFKKSIGIVVTMDNDLPQFVEGSTIYIFYYNEVVIRAFPI